jgi:hypothetical protein
LAAQHGSWIEHSGSGIQLHTNIRRNHRTEDGDALLEVHPKKYKDRRFRLVPRSNGPTKKEGYAADENSSHRWRRQGNE